MTVILTTMLTALLITSFGIGAVAFILVKHNAKGLDWDTGMFFLCATYILIAGITSISSCVIHDEHTMAEFRKECLAKNGLIKEAVVHHNTRDTFHTCVLSEAHKTELLNQ